MPPATLEVTDAAVQEYIDQHYGAENGSYSAKHILLKTVDDAGSTSLKTKSRRKKRKRRICLPNCAPAMTRRLSSTS